MGTLRLWAMPRGDDVEERDRLRHATIAGAEQVGSGRRRRLDTTSPPRRCLDSAASPTCSNRSTSHPVAPIVARSDASTCTSITAKGRKDIRLRRRLPECEERVLCESRTATARRRAACSCARTPFITAVIRHHGSEVVSSVRLSDTGGGRPQRIATHDRASALASLHSSRRVPKTHVTWKRSLHSIAR
jgi:hypothetical protein